MGDLRDFADFADPPLRLPIRGTIYEIPEPSVEAALQVIGVMRGTDTSLDKQPPETLWKLALGTAWDDLAAGKVGYPAIARAGLTAIVDIEYGRAAAIATWEGRTDPEPEASQEEAAENGPAIPQTTPPGEASTTPSPDAGAGTNTPPEPSRQPTP